MEAWYAIEERERQIAVLRESRRKRQRKQVSHPTSLFQSLQEPNIISPQSIRSLAETEYKGPVVSLYLQLNPEKMVPKEKGLARIFRSLKNGAFDKRKDFIAVLLRPYRDSLDHDLKEIDKIKSFVPTDTVDASIPGRVQRHRLTHLQWHLKLTARQASRLYSDWSCKVLVLMGEKRILHLLEGFLHETLREKIVRRVYG